MAFAVLFRLIHTCMSYGEVPLIFILHNLNIKTECLLISYVTVS